MKNSSSTPEAKSFNPLGSNGQIHPTLNIDMPSSYARISVIPNNLSDSMVSP